MRRTAFTKTAIGTGILLAAVLALTGCAAAGGSSGAYDEGAVPQAPVGGEVGGDAAEDSDGGGVAQPGAEREVIISGSVTVTAEEPLEAAADAVRIVEAAGGRVDGRTEYAATDGDRGSATLVLRIPAERLTAVLDDLKALGRADEVALSTDDVTVQSQDLDARISALQKTIARLEGLIAQAKDIDDLILLESEISNRQAELESLQAQQRYLDDQVAMSTISLYLRSDAEAPPTQPDTFWTGLGTGWDAFVTFWAGLLVVLGVLLPWLLLFGVVALVIILVVRRRRRRAAGAVAAAVPAPEATLPPPSGEPSATDTPAQPRKRSSSSKAKP